MSGDGVVSNYVLPYGIAAVGRHVKPSAKVRL